MSSQPPPTWPSRRSLGMRVDDSTVLPKQGEQEDDDAGYWLMLAFAALTICFGAMAVLYFTKALT